MTVHYSMMIFKVHNLFLTLHSGARSKFLHGKRNKRFPNLEVYEQNQRNSYQHRQRYFNDLLSVPYQIVPPGMEHFSPTQKRHFEVPIGQIKQFNGMLNLYDPPEKVQENVDFSLWTKDIEGAVPGTLISKAIKNKEKARKLKLQNPDFRSTPQIAQQYRPLNYEIKDDPDIGYERSTQNLNNQEAIQTYRAGKDDTHRQEQFSNSQLLDDKYKQKQKSNINFHYNLNGDVKNESYQGMPEQRQSQGRYQEDLLSDVQQKAEFRQQQEQKYQEQLFREQQQREHYYRELELEERQKRDYQLREQHKKEQLVREEQERLQQERDVQFQQQQQLKQQNLRELQRREQQLSEQNFQEFQRREQQAKEQLRDNQMRELSKQREQYQQQLQLNNSGQLQQNITPLSPSLKYQNIEKQFVRDHTYPFEQQQYIFQNHQSVENGKKFRNNPSFMSYGSQIILS